MGLQPGYRRLQPGYRRLQPGCIGLHPGCTGSQPGYGGLQPVCGAARGGRPTSSAPCRARAPLRCSRHPPHAASHPTLPAPASGSTRSMGVASSSTRSRAAAHDAVPAKRGEDKDERPAISGTARGPMAGGTARGRVGAVVA
eukprot:scaffold7222_cov55-Phaeocystis_antarctica.AAC.1